METKATLRGVRLSADKGRLVADMIRGMPVDRALNTLTYARKKAAGIVREVCHNYHHAKIWLNYGSIEWVLLLSVLIAFCRCVCSVVLFKINKL